MEVICIQSEAYNGLISEIKSIKKELKKDPTELLYTIPEACKILKCSARTLQTWRDKKAIDYIQIGNKVYFRQSDLNSFLEKHHIKSIQ